MRLIFACLAFLTAACAAAPETKYYLLESDRPAAARQQSTLPTIGLREIGLPLYARRPQIASIGADGSVSASDDHRWAEDATRAATRLVARRLEAVGGGDVFAEPWPIGAKPELIAAVEIDKAIGALGGSVSLTGEIILARRDARGDAVTTPFSITTETVRADHGALAEAYADAYAALAERIADAAAGL